MQRTQEDEISQASDHSCSNPSYTRQRANSSNSAKLIAQCREPTVAVIHSPREKPVTATNPHQNDKILPAPEVGQVPP